LMKSIEGERDLLLPNTVLDSLDNIRRLNNIVTSNLNLMFNQDDDEVLVEMVFKFKSQLGFKLFFSSS
jgi:hypothetical protein